MAEFDFAIVGTDLLSVLLAGLLARDHGKKVIRIGAASSPQRLWRQIPLALPLATNPHTWRMLRAGEAETRTLLAAIGLGSATTVLECGVIADTPLTGEALDHAAHMAAGYGHQVRRLPGGWAVRRATMLDPDSSSGQLTEWLATLGVRSIDGREADATVTVLADDSAIIDHLPEAVRPPPLVSQAMTSTLLAARLPAEPIQLFPDRGVTLVSRPGGMVLALVSGETEVEARLASSLRGPFPIKRLATTRYRRMITRDGAPLIGRPKGSKHVVVTGLGTCSAFMAPAVARFLAGASDAEERVWLTAHDPARPREKIADFIPSIESAS